MSGSNSNLQFWVSLGVELTPDEQREHERQRARFEQRLRAIVEFLGSPVSLSALGRCVYG